jgi:hypothetical protein
MMKYCQILWSLIIVISLDPSELVSQNTPWQIHGRVIQLDGQPLAGAAILVNDEIKATTDSSGNYRIKMGKKPLQIAASRLGFQKQTIAGNEIKWNDKFAQVYFVLEYQNLAIQEVTIRDKPTSTVFRENFSIDLVDFWPVNSNVLLLIREKKRHLLRLVDGSDRILSEIQVKGETLKQLHRSCTGALHVVGERWAWEITLYGNQLDTFPRYTAKQFHHKIEPCVAEKDGYYFFRKSMPFKQSVQYIVVDSTGKRRQFVEITQENAEKLAWFFHDDVRSGRLVIIPFGYVLGEVSFNPLGIHAPFITSVANVPKVSSIEKKYSQEHLMHHIEAYNNNQIASLVALETLRMDSIYAPIHKLSGKIRLFNHPYRDLLSLETAQWQIEHQPLNYHLEKYWEKDVIPDVSSGKAYGRFRHPKSGYVLQEIPLEQDTKTVVYEIPEAPFLSEKFRIQDGVLYFLGQPDVNTPNKTLYRLDLSKL